MVITKIRVAVSPKEVDRIDISTISLKAIVRRRGKMNLFVSSLLVPFAHDCIAFKSGSVDPNKPYQLINSHSQEEENETYINYQYSP
jgi:hypothetical protein